MPSALKRTGAPTSEVWAKPRKRGSRVPGISRVAIVGTGVIGASWSAQFLAAGLDVIATDPADGAEDRLREDVATHWPLMERLGVEPDGSPDRLTFTADLAAAVVDVDLVQENGPERLDFKRELFARMDGEARPDTILASSSSGLGPSAISSSCTIAPNRVIVAHPFNPPHLIPLVEIVGGDKTDTGTVDRAMAFYSSIGKQPIRVQMELPGHIANRLQAALWREAYSLVERGAVSVADLDKAISAGPGLRWSVLGPFANQHLSGGRDGLGHVLEHLGPPMVEWWQTLEEPEWTESLKATLVAGMNEELEGIEQSGMVDDRDRLLEQLLTAKSTAEHLPENKPTDNRAKEQS